MEDGGCRERNLNKSRTLHTRLYEHKLEKEDKIKTSSSQSFTRKKTSSIRNKHEKNEKKYISIPIPVDNRKLEEIEKLGILP